MCTCCQTAYSLPPPFSPLLHKWLIFFPNSRSMIWRQIIYRIQASVAMYWKVSKGSYLHLRTLHCMERLFKYFLCLPSLMGIVVYCWSLFVKLQSDSPFFPFISILKKEFMLRISSRKENCWFVESYIVQYFIDRCLANIFFALKSLHVLHCLLWIG